MKITPTVLGRKETNAYSDKLNSNRKNLPSEKFKKKLSIAILLSIVILSVGYFLEFNPIFFFTDGHYFIELLAEMFPPNFAIIWEKKSIGTSILETIAMAFLGTLLGGSIALFLSFFAASNTSPHPIVRQSIRALFSLERAIPSLVIILIYLIAVGLGPFAGFLALATSTVGMFGKLFADSIEEVNKEPINALYAIGGKKLQVIRFGIIPQVLPSFIANLFYAFDVNLRAAIGLGIFGGGGIGFEIHMAMKMLQYKNALGLIFITIILITSLEKLSDYFRNKLIKGDMLE